MSSSEKLILTSFPHNFNETVGQEKKNRGMHLKGLQPTNLGFLAQSLLKENSRIGGEWLLTKEWGQWVIDIFQKSDA